MNSQLIGPFGLTGAHGHIDFYANGGNDQPGCPKTIFAGKSYFVCDHQRSVFLFLCALNRTCTLTGYPCSSYSVFLEGRCLQCEAFKPASCPVLELIYRVDMVTWNQYLRWGVVFIRLHSGRNFTEVRLDQKLLRFEQYTSTRLLAQFDEDLHPIQKISMRINTGNVIGPRPLMCRFDIIMEENMELSRAQASSGFHGASGPPGAPAEGAAASPLDGEDDPAASKRDIFPVSDHQLGSTGGKDREKESGGQRNPVYRGVVVVRSPHWSQPVDGPCVPALGSSIRSVRSSSPWCLKEERKCDDFLGKRPSVHGVLPVRPGVLQHGQEVQTLATHVDQVRVQTSRPLRFPLLESVFFCPVGLPFDWILIRIFPECSVPWSLVFFRKILISLGGLLHAWLISGRSSPSTMAAIELPPPRARTTPPPVVHRTISITISHRVWSILWRRVPPSFMIVGVSPFILNMASSRVFPILQRSETLRRRAHWTRTPLPGKVRRKVFTIAKLLPT
ncbi:hypothetical protein FQN60_013480 [Etheostoma spectabile]|uniref:Lipase domain-containing protein n=1 Tax=Etheostoma spectabile TaxID=54343 RepID=A0A5J5CF32_9PERO|nr:hypothetical protein FQN60_013480 [Etheostoma spectabile]